MLLVTLNFCYYDLIHALKLIVLNQKLPIIHFSLVVLI